MGDAGSEYPPVVFLHEGRARFFGTMEEMEKCNDEVVQQFLELDALILPEA